MRRYVAVKPTNKAGVPSWRSQWSEASHPRGNRAVPHVPDSVPDFARPRDESVTAAGRLADLLTSCAAARPKGGAGCVSAHVRICPGPPGKPGGYRDVHALLPMRKERVPLLQGMLAGLEGRRDVSQPNGWATVAASLARDRHAESLAKQVTQSFSDAEAAQAMLATLLQAESDLEERRVALQRLAISQRDELREALPRLLGESALRLDAIRAVAAFDHPPLGKQLLSTYAALNAQEKTEAIQALASRPRYGWMLTEAIQSGQIPREDVPPHVARQLRRVVGSGFVEVWGPIDQRAGDKDALDARYRELLTPQAVSQANAGEGRRVFATACGACHQMYGEGGLVGPDLTGSNRTNLDYVLSNVLSPGEEIQDDYRMVIVTMRDGRTHIGSIASETERLVTMRLVGQPAVVLTRSDIQSLEESNMSLMPEGLFGPLSDQDVLNLVAYLRTAQLP